MSTNTQNNESQEIDLIQVSKKIGEFFEGIATQLFRAILFFKRNLIWIGVLFFVGIGLGFYLDQKVKVYNHQIIVQPNFNSVDYLYSKIELIESKIKENDTVFLKNVVGIKDTKKFRKIEIEPITDVYKFIENKEENFELIKLMADNGDIKKILSENITSKNYPYHLLSFVTLQETDYDKTVKPLMEYLNQSDFYSKVQKEFVNNTKIKMIENDSIIKQINGFLNTFSNTVNSSQKSDKLIYYNENSQLNDVIKTKDQLVYEQGQLRLSMVSLDKIVKNNAETLNIKNTEATNGKMIIVLPLLFTFLFILAGLIKSFYKKQLKKHKM